MNPERDRQELRDQYRIAIEEYRFQVDLNWRRSEYFFVLNIGVLVAGATLLASQDVPRAIVALVFGLGVLLAFLSFLANDTQRDYYRAARNRKKDIEETLGLTDVGIATTPGMGSPIARLGKVGTFLKTMLVAIACVDLVGAGLAASDAIDAGAMRNTSQVVIRTVTSPSYRGKSITVVVSRNGKSVATRSGAEGELLKPIGLEPGSYRAWIAGRRLCSRDLSVSSTPLQLAELPCGAARRASPP